MNWFAKWYHRPDDYMKERWLFLRNSWFVIIGLSLVSSIVLKSVGILDNNMFRFWVFVVFVMAFIIDRIRDKNPKNAQWNQDWFRGKYSKWMILWRG